MSFEEIPKKFLDSFRTINYIFPDTLKIIEGYFFLMDFPEHSLSFKAKQFLLFINLMNSSLDSSIEFDKNTVNSTNFDVFNENSKNIYEINLKSIINILNYAWNFFCDNLNEESLDPVSLMKASVERWLQSFVSPKKIEGFLAIFNVAFGMNKLEKYATFYRKIQ